jgi:uncharacterized protein YndB with AHSA1/START domain
MVSMRRPPPSITAPRGFRPFYAEPETEPAHDVGKIGGTANPEESVELLPRYGIVDPSFVALVKYHDVNLPWYLSCEKGQPPSDKLWRVLTEPEFTRQFWCATWQESEWKRGASWRMMIPDGRVGDSGQVLEIEPCRRLVLSWRNEFKPELRDEGPSRLTYELEAQGEMVKLTVIHESDTPGSKLIEKVSEGWPVILSSLKSLLETGASLEATRQWPKGV